MEAKLNITTVRQSLTFDSPCDDGSYLGHFQEESLSGRAIRNISLRISALLDL